MLASVSFRRTGLHIFSMHRNTKKMHHYVFDVQLFFSVVAVVSGLSVGAHDKSQRHTGSSLSALLYEAEANKKTMPGRVRDAEGVTPELETYIGSEDIKQGPLAGRQREIETAFFSRVLADTTLSQSPSPGCVDPELWPTWVISLSQRPPEATHARTEEARRQESLIRGMIEKHKQRKRQRRWRESSSTVGGL